jgi:acyl-CoA thioesterase YciA
MVLNVATVSSCRYCDIRNGRSRDPAPARQDPLLPLVFWAAARKNTVVGIERWKDRMTQTQSTASSLASSSSVPEGNPRYLALKTVMLPRDTNPYGTIFGGVILSYIDLAGAVGAQHEIRSRNWPDRTLVTVAMKSIEFHRPVWVGDIVSFLTHVVRVGRTSLTIHVSVDTERDGAAVHLTDAEVTYVSVEGPPQDQRPVPLRGETLPLPRVGPPPAGIRI